MGDPSANSEPLSEASEVASAISVASDLADGRIYCPDCDYDLTGLAENRCPECGHDFDPVRLKRWAGESKLPLTFSPRGPESDRLMPFLASAFYAPSHLGRRIPPHADYASAAVNALVIRLLACVVVPVFGLVLLTAITGSDGPIAAMLFLPVPLILGSWLCELVMAGVLTWLVEPRGVPRSARFVFWRALCRCFVVFLILTVPIFHLGVLSIAAANLGSRWLVAPGFYAIPILMLLWWSGALGLAVRARGIAGPARTVAILLIPCAGVVAVIAGLLSVVLPVWLLAQVFAGV